jgi:hypothetical protein
MTVLASTDLLPTIFSSLGDKELASAHEVCSAWQHIGRSTALWAPRVARRWPAMAGILKSSSDCYGLYRSHLRARAHALAPIEMRAEDTTFLAEVWRKTHKGQRLVFSEALAMAGATRREPLSWRGLRFQRSALNCVGGIPEALEEQSPEQLCETILSKCEWEISLSAVRASDNKVCALLVRSPLCRHFMHTEGDAQRETPLPMYYGATGALRDDELADGALHFHASSTSTVGVGAHLVPRWARTSSQLRWTLRVYFYHPLPAPIERSFRVAYDEEAIEGRDVGCDEILRRLAGMRWH